MTKITLEFDPDHVDMNSSLLAVLIGQANGSDHHLRPGPADPESPVYDQPASSKNLTKEQAAFKELFGYYPPKDIEEIGINEKDKRVALKALDSHDWRKGTPYWDVKTSA